MDGINPKHERRGDGNIEKRKLQPRAEPALICEKQYDADNGEEFSDDYEWVAKRIYINWVTVICLFGNYFLAMKRPCKVRPPISSKILPDEIENPGNDKNGYFLFHKMLAKK